MERFGILQVLHADSESIGVADGWTFNLRAVCLWDVQSGELVLIKQEKTRQNKKKNGGLVRL